MSEVIQTPAEKIKQRRTQMFLHSYLYYNFVSVVPDASFDRWARELVELQKTLHDVGFYDEDFLGWDGHTGCHLKIPLWLQTRAHKLLAEEGMLDALGRFEGMPLPEIKGEEG